MVDEYTIHSGRIMTDSEIFIIIPGSSIFLPGGVIASVLCLLGEINVHSEVKLPQNVSTKAPRKVEAVVVEVRIYVRFPQEVLAELDGMCKKYGVPMDGWWVVG